MNIDNLRKFLLSASTTGYAVGDTVISREKDLSYTSAHGDGDWKFHDNWFGGEPFGGREVVFFQDKPYWMAVYYGKDSGKADGLIPFLRVALSKPPAELPVRGPQILEQGEFKYINEWKGDLEDFTGEEIIYFKGEEVYRAGYLGGLVDQRKDQM